MIKVGIDYGTTTTLVSYTRGETRGSIPKPTLINIGGEQRRGYERSSIPSVIAITKQGVSFGYKAEKLSEGNDRDVVLLRSLKRCISCNRQEGQKADSCLNMGNFPYCFGGKKFTVFNETYSLNDLLCYFLKEVIKLSLSQIKLDSNNDIDAIGISVPAIFGSQPRHTIFDNILKIFPDGKSVDIINEPTAAIIACQNEMMDKEDGIYVICDVGGGTTDIVVFEKNQEKKTPYFFFKPSGCQVGGDDIDFALLNHFLPHHPISDQNLKEARRAKELLTVSNTVSIYDKKLSRETFQEIIKPVLFRIIEALREEIQKVFDFYKPYSQTGRRYKLNGIYLSGGGSKIPFLKQLIEKDEKISNFEPEIGFIKDNELYKIYSDDLPIVAVALGTSIPKAHLADSIQHMLPYEIRIFVGGELDSIVPIFAELPLNFKINNLDKDTIQIIAVDPSNPNEPVYDLGDVLFSLTYDQRQLSTFLQRYNFFDIKIDEYNIMRVTATHAAQMPNRPFQLPWQGGIETPLFEKYRKDWRRKHGYD